VKSKEITAFIQTKNEAHRLPLIFKNLDDFAEIIVFDGGSIDGTKSVCDNYGVEFITRPSELRAIVGGDMKFILPLIKTPYVLQVNCSHYYPRRLLEVFKHVAEEGEFLAVYHDVVVYTFGRIVHRPFLRRRSSATNFYHVDAVNFSKSIVHNDAPVEAAVDRRLVLPPEDSYAIHLFRDYNVKKSELNHSFYGDQDAQLRFNSGVRTNVFLMILRPLKHFLYQYLRCGSIKYGVDGLIYSALYAQLEMNIQFKIWELQNQLDLPNIIKRNLSIRTEMDKSDRQQINLKKFTDWS
jgi:glycosyltransferase involved in cell wall biosynthesis